MGDGGGEHPPPHAPNEAQVGGLEERHHQISLGPHGPVVEVANPTLACA